MFFLRMGDSTGALGRICSGYGTSHAIQGRGMGEHIGFCQPSALCSAATKEILSTRLKNTPACRQCGTKSPFESLRREYGAKGVENPISTIYQFDIRDQVKQPVNDDQYWHSIAPRVSVHYSALLFSCKLLSHGFQFRVKTFPRFLDSLRL